MIRSTAREACFAALLLAALLPCPAAAQGERPNIVVILADDLGYSDIGAYGGEIRTPNLDRLAAGGVRFRQFYNSALCAPTRAALLTGRNPHEVGMGELPPGRGEVGAPGAYQGYFPAGTVTIADALRAAGYGTYMSGKWHVGDNPDHWPRRHGFDRYFGLLSGATSFWELLQEPGRPREMLLEDELWTPPATGFYATDAYSDYAVDRIRQHRRERRDRPFFLYVAYTAPHFPLHAPEEDIARYRGRYDIGWDSLRVERYQRMRQLGIATDRHLLPPHPAEVPRWAESADRADWARRMEVYAAMVDRMDQGIGRILRALEETGADENTLILFLSDNGACATDVAGRNLNDPSVPMGAKGSYVGYNEPWAYASATPFRLYKTWTHEGGINTPAIAYWPRAMPRGGTITGEAGHTIDILPTALELAGVRWAEVAGADARPLEGRSFASVLRGQPAPVRHVPMYFARGANWALRDGRWKLVHDAQRAKRLELYDLDADPTELRDLSAAHPERVAAMQTTWRRWADHYGVERPARTTLTEAR